MMPSRGMGAIRPSKMPGAKTKARRDDTDFTQYAEGGKTAAEKVKAKEKTDAEEQALKQDKEPRVNRLPLSFDGMAGNDAYGGLGASGRATFTHPLTKNSSLQASVEGGGYKPKDQEGKWQNSKSAIEYNLRFKKGGLAKQAATAIAMKAVGKKPKKMAAGGETKSTVNAAGNYTKPELRKRIFNAVKAEATAGTGAGQWSARKSQVLAKRYKAAGGGYRD
jgi:hypothetical protein